MPINYQGLYEASEIMDDFFPFFYLPILTMWLYFFSSGSGRSEALLSQEGPSQGAGPVDAAFPTPSG